MRQLHLTERVSGALHAALLTPGYARYERFDPQRAESVVLRRLRRVVDDAARHVPFYRDRYRAAGYQPGDLRSLDDLRHLPIIDKEDLLSEPLERRMRPSVPTRRHLPSVTSGTSGRVLTVVHDGGRLGLMGLAVLRVTRLVTPHRPWHRVLYVYSAPLPVRSVLGSYPFDFVPTTSPLELIADRWQALRPDVVWIYPSRLSELLDAGFRLPSPRLVSVNSEASSAAERAHLEAAVGAPVRDQYGTEELGIVAAECGERRLHVFTDSCWIELLGSDGNAVPAGRPGDVVGTNLSDLVTPVIRYRQGDRATFDRELCPCGRRLPVLSSVLGRSRYDITLADGRVVTSGVVLDALYGLLLDEGLPLRAYQLVVGDPCELRLAAGPGFPEDGARRAAASVAGKTGLTVVGRMVADLTSSGKRQLVVHQPTAEK